MTRLLTTAKWAAWATSLLLLWIWACPAAASERIESQINLTREEQKFLSDHPVIRVDNLSDWPPFNYFESGKPRGFSIDYMNHLASLIGVKIEYITGPTWDEFLGMIKGGDIDVMIDIVNTPQRRKYLHFTKPYASNPNAILSQSDTPYNNLEQLSGKTVSVPKGYFYEEILKRDFPQIELHLVKNVAESMKAILFGEADAALGELSVFNYLIKRDLISGLAISGEVKLGDPNYSKLNIATRKGLPELATIFDKAIGAVTPEVINSLRQRWIDAKPAAPYPFKLILTPEERAWIADHPIIRTTALKDWPPFDFRAKNGVHSGISADLIRMAAERVGLKLVPVFDDWNILLQKLKNRELDVAPSIYHTPAREEYIAFTEPYLELYDAIFTADSTSDVSATADLIGRTVAVERGFYTIELLSKNFPGIRLLIVDDSLEALKAVSSGKADAYIGTQYVGSHLIKKYIIPNLKTVGFFGDDPNKIYMGVRKDWPILRDILNKALVSITVEEKRQVLGKFIVLGGGVERKTRSVNLTAKEKAWLAEHNTMRFGVDPGFPPFEFVDENGVFSGMALDYIRLLNERLGISMEPVPGLSWVEVLSGVKGRNLDFSSAAAKTPEREEYMTFTRPHMEFPVVIVTREDYAVISGLDDLRGKTTALIRKFAVTEELKAKGLDLAAHMVDTPLEALQSVATGKTEAAVMNLAVATYYINNQYLSNLKLAAIADMELPGLSLAVRKDWPEFVEILNKALTSITVEEKNEIRSKWVPVQYQEGLDLKPGVQKENDLAKLTADEKAWIDDHRNIRLGVDSNYPPFEFVDENGNYAGMVSDYVRLVSEKLGIKMEVVRGLSWEEVLDGVKGRTLDVLPGAGVTPERESYVNFSNPHTAFPVVIVTRDDYPFIAGLKDLKGKVVAQSKGYAVTSHIEANHKEIELRFEETPLQSLRAVSAGEVSATALNLAVATYLIRKHNLANLKVAAPVDIDVPGIAFAVRKDWPELVGILNKALLAITPEESSTIRSKWVSIEYQAGVDFELVMQVGGASAITLIVFVWWNRRLRREIVVRKKTEKALEDAYGIIKDQKERMEDELNVGRAIQLSMIPLVFPPYPHHHEFSIFASLEPAREVGGDFYDFFFIDQDMLCFCIGDVSGKGVPAALFMAMTKTLIKSRAGDDTSTASILTHVNERLSEENDNFMFVTVFLGIMDIKTGSLTFTNAGHNPPYIKRANGELQRLDDRHGPIIGALSGQVYEEGTELVAPDDLLFLYTDGVTEQLDKLGNFYSEDRLVRILETEEAGSDEAVINRTVHSVERFRGEIEQSDDITLLALRYLGSHSEQPHAELNLDINNDLSEISRVHSEMDIFASEHGLQEELGQRANLILEEILNNVISYGFLDDREHSINIKMEFSQSRLTSTITDDGIPFNPFNYPAADTKLPLEKRRVGGLGIHLVQNMIEDTVYRRRIGKNILTFSILNIRNK